MSEPATEKQVFLMNKLKIAFNPNVTKQEASKLIDAKMGNKPKDVTNDYPNGFAGVELNKDILIVRQSCLKAAVEAMNLIKPEQFDKDMAWRQIEVVAEEFEKWVFR